jgi:hypothetical protein
MSSVLSPAHLFQHPKYAHLITSLWASPCPTTYPPCPATYSPPVQPASGPSAMYEWLIRSYIVPIHDTSTTTPALASAHSFSKPWVSTNNFTSGGTLAWMASSCICEHGGSVGNTGEYYYYFLHNHIPIRQSYTGLRPCISTLSIVSQRHQQTPQLHTSDLLACMASHFSSGSLSSTSASISISASASSLTTALLPHTQSSGHPVIPALCERMYLALRQMLHSSCR